MSHLNLQVEEDAREISSPAGRVVAGVGCATVGPKSMRMDDCPLAIPDVVARYLRYAVPGNRRILAATVEQEGEFRLGTSGSRWRPFKATERFLADSPQFEWNAQIRLAPLSTVNVRDAYIRGAGSTSASLFGYSFLNEHGRPELNAGALQRYLAEAVWFPTTLVGGVGITWRGVDANNAIATIQDGRTSATLGFRINNVGEITRIFTRARFRAVKGTYVPTPWVVRCKDYVEADGFRIPVRCEVEWWLPEGTLVYWRGRVVGVRYEFAPEVKAWTPRPASVALREASMSVPA